MLSKGEVVEFDSPAALLLQPEGYFARMVRLGRKQLFEEINPGHWSIQLWQTENQLRKETALEATTKASL